MHCYKLLMYLDAGAPAPTPQAALDHLSDCPSCRRAWRLAHETAASLKALPEPPLPAGFEGRVLASAFRAAGQRRQTRVRGWGLALAATFVMGIAVGILLQVVHVGHAGGGYALQDGTITLTSGDVTTVRIALDATHPIKDVGFVIDVPAGMELEGHPDEQQVAWQGELQQGRNLLGLRLLAKPGAAGILQTEIHHDGQSSIFKVHVVAVEESTLWNLLRRMLS